MPFQLVGVISPLAHACASTTWTSPSAGFLAISFTRSLSSLSSASTTYCCPFAGFITLLRFAGRATLHLAVHIRTVRLSVAYGTHLGRPRPSRCPEKHTVPCCKNHAGTSNSIVPGNERTRVVCNLRVLILPRGLWPWKPPDSGCCIVARSDTFQRTWI